MRADGVNVPGADGVNWLIAWEGLAAVPLTPHTVKVTPRSGPALEMRFAAPTPNPQLRSPNQSVGVASFSAVAMASFSSVVDRQDVAPIARRSVPWLERTGSPGIRRDDGLPSVIASGQAPLPNHAHALTVSVISDQPSRQQLLTCQARNTVLRTAPRSAAIGGDWQPDHYKARQATAEQSPTPTRSVEQEPGVRQPPPPSKLPWGVRTSTPLRRC